MSMNTPTITNKKKELYSLRSCKKACFDRERAYELFCESTDGERFFVSIREGEDEAVGEVACSFADAAALFDRIVRGEVAPYVLGEILEDFGREIE